jgi:hypothetical protein
VLIGVAVLSLPEDTRTISIEIFGLQGREFAFMATHFNAADYSSARLLERNSDFVR